MQTEAMGHAAVDWTGLNLLKLHLPDFLTTSIALGMGTSDNPGPGRILREWAFAEGPQTRSFDIKSDFGQSFLSAPSVVAIRGEALHYWQTRTGGIDANGGLLTNYAGRFGFNEFASDGVALNGAAHVIGEFGITARATGNILTWTATNDMGVHSFYGGSRADRAGVYVPSNVSRPSYFGTTTQVITWQTDRSGRIIR